MAYQWMCIAKKYVMHPENTWGACNNNIETYQVLLWALPYEYADTTGGHNGFDLDSPELSLLQLFAITQYFSEFQIATTREIANSSHYLMISYKIGIVGGRYSIKIKSEY